MKRYKKADIILVRFPFTNAAEFKMRPALVIRDQKGDDLNVLPISTKINLDREDLIISKQDYVKTALPVESVIRISKITTIHSELVIKKVAALKPGYFKEVQMVLFRYLG